ncbi:hypothetical protein [Luteibacter sp. 9135]|nr:hypothetical protein [Luteibacter sp. 9135]
MSHHVTFRLAAPAMAVLIPGLAGGIRVGRDTIVALADVIRAH